MSAALFAKIQELESRLNALDGEVAEFMRQTSHSLERLESLCKDSASQGEKVATLWALREAIEKDAREMLDRKRPRIDPTQVKMPPVLKKLGYEVPK